MSELHFPWLEISILLPFFGGLLVWLRGKRDEGRSCAIVVSGITLGLTVGEWIDFAQLGAFEAHDHWDVIEAIFHRDVFVIDELSAPLLPLAALGFFVTILSTLRTKAARFSFASTLLSEAIVLATFSCRASWPLVLLLCLSVIPPWVELRQRGRCTRVYTLHMGLFVTLLCVGYAIFRWTHTPGEPALVAGGILTAAALIRSGTTPLHCWMTDLMEKATFGTAMLFVSPLSGAYAIRRFVLPIAPDWALQVIAILSLITAVYAAGMALVQTDARRFFCYVFLSNSSLVLVGLELLTPIGLTGALCVWLSVGTAVTGFGITLRCIESRIGRISLDRYHGLYEQMPILAMFSLLTGLASIGFPGTIGFIAIELLLEGAVEVYPSIGFFVVIATSLNGIAILQCYFRVFTGCRYASSINMQARPSERLAVLILSLLILSAGIVPQPSVHSRFHAAIELREHRESPDHHRTPDDHFLPSEH